MTNIIARLNPDAATAQAVMAALLGHGHNLNTMDLIVRDGASDLMNQMRAARVGPDAAAT